MLIMDRSRDGFQKGAELFGDRLTISQLECKQGILYTEGLKMETRHGIVVATIIADLAR